MTEGPYERGESIVVYADWEDDDETPIAPVNPRLELTSPSDAVLVFLEADMTTPVGMPGRREVPFDVPDTEAAEGLWVARWSATGPKPKAETQTFQVLKPQ